MNDLMDTPEYAGGFVLALLSAVCYGSITTFATFAYRAGVDVEQVVISRGVIVAGICVCLSIITGEPLALRGVRPLRMTCLALSLLATATCQLGAVQYLSVDLTVILFFTFPIFVTIFDLLRGSLRPHPRQILPPVLAFGGVVIAIGHGNGAFDLAGVSLAILAAMSMAASIVIAQTCMTDTSVLGLALLGNLLASVLGLVLWWISGYAQLPHFGAGQMAFGLTMILAVGGLFGAGIIFQFQGIRRIGSVPTSLTLNFEPIVTLLVAAVMLGEPLSASNVAGASLIILSVFMTSKTLRSSTNKRITS